MKAHHASSAQADFLNRVQPGGDQVGRVGVNMQVGGVDGPHQLHGLVHACHVQFHRLYAQQDPVTLRHPCAEGQALIIALRGFCAAFLIIDVITGYLEHPDSGVHAELNGPFHEPEGKGTFFIVHGSHGETALAAEAGAVDLYAAVLGGLAEAASLSPVPVQPAQALVGFVQTQFKVVKARPGRVLQKLGERLFEQGFLINAVAVWFRHGIPPLRRLPVRPAPGFWRPDRRR